MQTPVIDESEFRVAAEQVENEGPHPTFSVFFTKLCETQWARGINLKPYTAHVRCRELGIVVNLNRVKPIKSIPLLPLHDEEKSILQLSKEAICGKPKVININVDSPEFLQSAESVNPNKAHYDEMRKTFKPKFGKIIDSAEKGSLKAHITLNCLECSGQSMTSIKHCTIKNCSLYTVRPWQDKEPISL